MSLIEAVKESEGFRDKVYKCTEGMILLGMASLLKT